MRATWPLWFICAALLIWDAVQLAKSSAAAEEGAASERWPTASGIVTKSEIGTLATGGRDDRIEYSPSVAYTFRVGTIEHVGHRVLFTAFDRKTHDEAAAIIARYPVGTTVVVHYDPDDPDDAVLEPGAPTTNWRRKVTGVALVALAFAAAAIVIMIVGARRRRAR